MADLTVPRGDKGYYITFTVQDSAGTAYNLTDYTITVKVWKDGDHNNLIVNSAAAIVVAASGTCRYLVTATDFLSKGIFNLELELTKTGVIESTRKYTVEVTESG